MSETVVHSQDGKPRLAWGVNEVDTHRGALAILILLLASLPTGPAAAGPQTERGNDTLILADFEGDDGPTWTGLSIEEARGHQGSQCGVLAQNGGVTEARAELAAPVDASAFPRLEISATAGEQAAVLLTVQLLSSAEGDLRSGFSATVLLDEPGWIDLCIHKTAFEPLGDAASWETIGGLRVASGVMCVDAVGSGEMWAPIRYASPWRILT